VEVILKEDIVNLGKIGEIVRVRDGYARNYLLPRGLVLVANKKNMTTFEHQKKLVADQKQKIMKHAQAVGDQLAGVSLTIAMRAGEEGRLFGSVTNIQIEKALKAKGLNVERRKIHLPEPIKNLGEYEVPIRLAADVTVPLKLSVVAEESGKQLHNYSSDS
jgi:large subunit ribosomal protein L9